MLSRHGVGIYQGNELTRSSSGNTRPQLSRLAEPQWTDPGVKSGTSVREMISALKKIKKCRREMNRPTFAALDGSFPVPRTFTALRMGNLHGSGMSCSTAASPKPSCKSNQNVKVIHLVRKIFKRE